MIDASVGGAYARAGQTLGALGNSAYVGDLPLGSPGVHPSYMFLAIALTARQTGVFAVGGNFAWASAAANDATTISVQSLGWSPAAWLPVQSSGKITLTADAPAGVVGASAGNPINGGTAPGIYVCSGAGTSIVATPTGAGSVVTPTLSMIPNGNPTGGYAQSWSASLIAPVGIANPKIPYAVGSPVVLSFVIGAAGSLTLPGYAAFWAYELPAT